MVTKKEIYVEYSQLKMRRELKHFITRKLRSRNEGSNGVNEEVTARYTDFGIVKVH